MRASVAISVIATLLISLNSACTASSLARPQVFIQPHAVFTRNGALTATAPAVQGVITGTTVFGFDLNPSPGYPRGIVPVIVGISTVFSPPFHPAAGMLVSVSGAWTAQHWLTATLVTQVSAAVPKHVLTYDYLGGYYGTHNVTWSQAAPYLNWAATQAADSVGIHAAGIKTLFYSNPTRAGTSDPLASSPETAFAHDCSGRRVYTMYAGRVMEYVMDPSTLSLRSSFLNMVLNPTLARGAFDAVYEDNAGPLSEYGIANFSLALPCGYTDAAWVNGEAGLEGSLPLPTIFNGLSGLNPYGGYGVSLSTGLFQNASTIGGNYEHCYTQNSPTTPKYFGSRWQANENTEITVALLARIFVCNPTDSYAPAGSARQIDDRMYAYASFLLTYDVNTSTMWDYYLAGPSGLHVYPEEQLVALNPVVSEPTSIASLQISTGVYGREYRNCYIASVAVGPCAAVVNSDYYAGHPFPYTTYRHALTLSGAGIFDGGAVSTSGVAPTSLPPLGSAILFQ